jgi:hypothetical protein
LPDPRNNSHIAAIILKPKENLNVCLI